MVRLLKKKKGEILWISFLRQKVFTYLLKGFFFFFNNSIIWGERGFKVCLSFKEEQKISIELQFIRLLTFMKD